MGTTTGAIEATPQLWWFVARASGIVTWVLVVAAVLWGLWLAGRVSRKLPPPAWTLDLHRFLGGLSLTFLAVHLVGLVADDYVHFGWSELFVPLASAWRPWPVAFGIVALYLLVAVEVTSLLMKRLPRRAWHAVHLLSFAVAFLGTVHGLTAGADAGTAVVRTGVIVAVGLVAAFVVLRLGMPRVRRARRQTVRSSTAASTV